MPALPAADCWFLCGPTASGKTAVGIELARRLGAEIISLDSMALYRGMDIGTAKPTAAELQLVPHHLVDILSPHEEYSLAQYLEAAAGVVADIHARGHRALFVGGTPLYLKGLLRGIFEGPPADLSLRHGLREQALLHPPGYLHQKLAEVDPQAAGRLHPNDTRRLIRALEVQAITGVPISRWQRQFDVGRPADACHVWVLAWDKEALDRRIEARVDAMFAAGLVAEVGRLLELSPPLSHTARQAVGYREVIEHLQGQHSLEETVLLVKQHTRQLAKRQRTWLRSLSECRFLPVAEPLAAADVVEQILLKAESQ